jgi:amino acid transporter
MSDDVVVGESRTSPWACLAACTICAITALIAATFNWTLIDCFPALIFLPGHLIAAIAPLAVCAIWALFEVFRLRRGGLVHAAPFLVCAVTVLLLFITPFTQIWLNGNFWWHRAERERIVWQVESGQLRPNVAHNGSLTALGGEQRNGSAGGNELMVETPASQPWVLFFTFRGINHYSGFLYVPGDGTPHAFMDLSDRRHQVVSYSKNWFFVAR